jgi:Sel1 repeat
MLQIALFLLGFTCLSSLAPSTSLAQTSGGLRFVMAMPQEKQETALVKVSNEEQDKLLEEIYMMGDFALLKRVATVPANLGSPPALFFLGQLYMFGPPEDKDEAKAVQYISKAAEGGNLWAKLTIGVHSMVGRLGFVKDEKKAVEYLKASYGLSGDGAFALAKAFEQGSGGLEKDPKKAAGIYQSYKWQGTDIPIAKKRLDALGLVTNTATQTSSVSPGKKHQDLFVKVMQAAKSIGVQVSAARAEDESYLGSGKIRVNGNINVDFEAELMTFSDQLPKLFITFKTDEQRLQAPLRERLVAALKNEVGTSDLRAVFNRNSSMFGW